MTSNLGEKPRRAIRRHCSTQMRFTVMRRRSAPQHHHSLHRMERFPLNSHSPSLMSRASSRAPCLTSCFCCRQSIRLQLASRHSFPQEGEDFSAIAGLLHNH